MVYLIAMLSLANPAPAAPLPADVRDALTQLDHPQFRVRSKAARTVVAAGSIVIDPLRKLAEDGTVEAADRALKILEELAAKPGTESAAHDALYRLATGESQARDGAREIRKRHRAGVLDIMREAGAHFQFDGDDIRVVNFDRVLDMDAMLPLLRELPELTEFSASTKRFGDPEFKQLLPLKKLRLLNLFESDIGDDSLKHFREFPNLESVPMGQTRVTDAGLKNLGELKKLDYLGLRGNQITDAGLVYLKNLPALTALTLEETRVTGTGFEHLHGLKLQTLRLQNSGFTDDGAKLLHGIKSLRQVDLRGTKVTGPAVENLREALPDVNVVSRDGE